MAVAAKRMTVEEFERFIQQPDNAQDLYEFIGGEIIEVPSNPYSSQIAALIIAALVTFLKGTDLGHVTGEAGGYHVSGERYAPDAAFISRKRQQELPREGYNPNPPDLAVEVVSPSDTERLLMVKVANYLAAGTVVWVVYPVEYEVAVYAPGEPAQRFGIEGTLDGGSVLPGFSLPVREIFPENPGA